MVSFQVTRGLHDEMGTYQGQEHIPLVLPASLKAAMERMMPKMS